ncbi:unnamed protein product [Lota lota]
MKTKSHSEGPHGNKRRGALHRDWPPEGHLDDESRETLHAARLIESGHQPHHVSPGDGGDRGEVSEQNSTQNEKLRQTQKMPHLNILPSFGPELREI